VKKKGVVEAKPLHYGQMQLYMHAAGLTRALYYVVCTDDDREHAERVEYNGADALLLLAKAEQIVSADHRPPRIAEDPTAKGAWICGVCPAKGVCHGADFAPRNCRTCLHAAPKLDGDARWWCERHRRDLSVDDQRAGCANHLYLPDLVPGDQVDVDAEGERVTYQLTRGDLAGRSWTDGVKEPAHA